MSTIYDVAKEAGVAPSTVSYVLNNTKNVKKATRQKVLDAVKKLNYTPNHIARSLKTKTTSTIGIVIPDISNPFFSELTRGIEDIANQYDYTVIICNTDENQKKEKKYLNTLISKGIDGLIFVGTGKYKIKKGKDLPTVLVDRYVDIGFRNYGYVAFDNIEGSYIATSYLVQKGFKEITLLLGPIYLNTYMDRLKGYKKALLENKIDFNKTLIHVVSEQHISIEGGFNKVKELIKESKITDAIFATNDLMAIGAIKALQENNIRVPEDIKVIGFDDIYPSALITPSLTTISQPTYKMGQKAMKMLYGIISGSNLENKVITLKPKLAIRESV